MNAELYVMETPGNESDSWLRSLHFKLWVVLVHTSFYVKCMCTSIESTEYRCCRCCFCCWCATWLHTFVFVCAAYSLCTYVCAFMLLFAVYSFAVELGPSLHSNTHVQFLLVFLLNVILSANGQYLCVCSYARMRVCGYVYRERI